MGWKYQNTGSASAYVGQGVLKSVIASPQANGATSAHVTVYNATAATAGTEMMYLYCGSAGNTKTVTWSSETGMLFSNLWCAVNCAVATLVWD